MCCILCYNGLVNVFNSRLQAIKRLISYYKITHVKKHVDVNDVIVVKRFEEEVNSLMRRTKEKQPTNVSKGSISKQTCERFLQKGFNVLQKQILENLNLLIVKNNLSI
jgi:hypothetical protein